MTAREKIDRRRRKRAWLFLLCVVLFVPTFLWWMKSHSNRLDWILPGIELLIPAGMLISLTSFVVKSYDTCPHCENGIDFLPSQGRFGVGLSRDIQFCPFCGESFDAELEKAGDEASGAPKPAQS